MDDFARRAPEDRRAYIEEAASRRDLTPIIIEKDFWVCWTLRHLTRHPHLAGQVTFKGGTSLSKAYRVIERFSEDIDLTIRRSAPLLDAVASPMEAAISGKERERRTKALKAAAQAYVTTIVLPALTDAVERALGGRDGWSIEPDPEDAEGQTLLFNYPRAPESTGTAYIKPRIKLEFGARGDPEPFEERGIIPYLAEAFPEEMPDALTAVETLGVERTFWEKATILHALHHNGKLRDGLSRHYYDLVMLDLAGVAERAVDQTDLLEQVVRNKSLMFADKSASYETAVSGSLRLLPTAAMREVLERDYSAMADMFMVAPPRFEELLDRLTRLEARLNLTRAEARAVQG